MNQLKLVHLQLTFVQALQKQLMLMKQPLKLKLVMQLKHLIVQVQLNRSSESSPTIIKLGSWMLFILTMSSTFKPVACAIVNRITIFESCVVRSSLNGFLNVVNRLGTP